MTNQLETKLHSALTRPETRLQLQLVDWRMRPVVTPSWLGEVVEFYLLIF